MAIPGAKTSRSADIKAANGKLAMMLRKREEDEALLTIGKGKTRDVAKNEPRIARSKKGGLKQKADFSYPTPLVDRPRTASGHQSFHFSATTVSITGIPTSGGKPIVNTSANGFGGGSTQPALDHSKYIERDGAAEQGKAADHADYVERDGAAETGRTRDPDSTLGEALNDDESKKIGLEVEYRDGAPSIFSNISNDPFERQEYWRAVERCERVPRAHLLNLDPDASPEWWAKLDANERLDPSFKSHALQVREAHRQYHQLAVPGAQQKPFRAVPYTVSSDRAGEIIQQSQVLDGYDNSRPPLEFESGRGGRVQIRFVAELPHEISPEDRALIVQNFCDHLGSFATDDEGKATGLMYTAVIHAPDIHNDSRNYHLHIVAHDRPASFMPDLGQWDFEIAESYQDPGSRKMRVHYPHRQNKIGEASRNQDAAKNTKGRDGRDFIPAMRNEFARITNIVLEQKGVAKRYDPRKYTEMGIDREPTEHLGTKAAALEALGVPTTVGMINAVKIWSDAERSIGRVCDEEDKTYKIEQANLVELLNKAVAARLQNEASTALRAFAVERDRLISDVAEDRRAVLTFSNLEAKAKSRAVRTRQTCLAYLADINSGKTSATTARLKPLYIKRFDEAQAHVDMVDRTLEPHRASVAEMSASILEREQRIAAIDRALAPIKTKLAESIRHAASAQKQTPVSAPAPGVDSNAAAPGPPAYTTPGKASGPMQKPPAVPVVADAPVTTKPAKKAADGLPDLSTLPADKRAAVVVPLGPASIDGLPIVEPVLTAAPVIATNDAQAPAQELEPLRPVATPETSEPVTTPTIVDLDTPVTANDTQTQTATPAAETPVASPDEKHAGAAPKIDGRRKPEDPSLFPLPVQTAPIKAGSSAEEYAAWDNLMNRISTDRVPIHSEQNDRGGNTFLVPSLTREERDLLALPRFGNRSNNRLGSIYGKQQLEIDRLVRWIDTAGRRPDLLSFNDRKASMKNAPQSIKTLMSHWHSVADVNQALRNENKRRNELPPISQQVQADTVKPANIADPAIAQQQLAERRERVAKLYPAIAAMVTPAAKDFVGALLAADVTDSKMEELADVVRSKRNALDEIMRHGADLAAAYHYYAKGAAGREASRARTETPQKPDRSGR